MEEMKPNPEVTTEGEDVSGTNAEYIKQIKRLKETTVPKDEFEKLSKEKDELIQALANGDGIDVETPVPPDIQQLRNKLKNPDLTNLEFAQTALELRDALLEKGERDPFLGIGQKYDTTADREREQASADNVARIFRECIEDADGDSDVFTSRLQSHIL